LLHHGILLNILDYLLIVQQDLDNIRVELYRLFVLVELDEFEPVFELVNQQNVLMVQVIYDQQQLVVDFQIELIDFSLLEVLLDIFYDVIFRHYIAM